MAVENGLGESGTRGLNCGGVTSTGHYSGGLCYLSSAVLLTGFRQLACVVTGALGVTIATREGPCLFPRVCSGSREQPQGGIADSGLWHFVQRWLRLLWKAL